MKVTIRIKKKKKPKSKQSWGSKFARRYTLPLWGLGGGVGVTTILGGDRPVVAEFKRSPIEPERLCLGPDHP